MTDPDTRLTHLERELSTLRRHMHRARRLRRRIGVGAVLGAAVVWSAAASISSADPGDPVPHEAAHGELSARDLDENFEALVKQIGVLDGRIDTRFSKSKSAYISTSGTAVEAALESGATASCRDSSDLLLSGGCALSDPGGTLVANHPRESGVSSTMSSAKWQCTATRPEGSASNRLTAYALCLAVP